MSKHLATFIPLSLLWIVACDEAPVDPNEDSTAPTAIAAPTATTPPTPDPAPPIATQAAVQPQARTMPGAKAQFETLIELVEQNYVDGPITEDALWTAAIEGVLSRLVQLPDHPVNELLDPRQHGDLESAIKGKVSGIGVQIERVADVLVVRELVPGGSAQRSGLRAGDRILGVDGQRVAGIEIGDVVGRIRGPAGSKVDLFVQRDTEEWTETLVRGEIEVPNVDGRGLEGGIAYVRIDSLGKNTRTQLDTVLGKVVSEASKGIVLDLRHCPGGLFDAAIDVAGAFLPAKAEIVVVRGRSGAPERMLNAAAGDHLRIPLVLLVGPWTSSGAEVIAAALREHGRASLVGEPTLGKGTIESIVELDNGWALKLSEKRFESPKGATWDRVGLQPDVRVATPKEARRPALAEVAAASDAALAAAVHLIATKG